MRSLPALLVLALCACDGPSGGFAGVAPVVVTSDGSTFSVRIRGDAAEAVRTNMEFAPSLAAVAPRAVDAIERASGCRVAPGSVTGDAAMVRADLDCPDA